MKNVTKLLFMAGSGFLLSGCIASERDMSTLKLQLQELNATIVQMQSNQAELAGKMDELNSNLSASNENLAQVDAQINKLSAKLDDLSVSVRTAPAVQAEKAQTAQPAALLPSDLFAEAKSHLDKGAYEPAAMGFKLYTSKYPDSENVEQAYMYMGDAYIAAGQTKSGAVAYATLLQKFPKSKFIPSARLKYALSIVPLGKKDEAKRYLSSVVQDFPASPEAKKAEAELAKIK
ncbi:tetratricopeptide repeat protein [Candidatus Avelusimicrobium fimicolum]|uniref:tetratricopeptide repeat protein n=1 Tax=Candidatus Avelusimicrobium fimicolum TaxID=3416216 RepID=UPI003D0DCEA4